MNIALKDLDKVIVDQHLAWKEAEARYAARARLCDVLGREHTPEDTAELKAAHAAGEAAKEILCETVPQTMAGVRALLEYVALDKNIESADANAIAANIWASPALAA
jgi:hypothetical protein